MDSEQEEYSLCSENFQTILTENLTDFLKKKYFADVTLVCKGEEVKAHQVILAAFSPLFKKLLIEKSQSHPIIIFNDITKEEMITLLEFIYKGKVNVNKASLQSLLKAAKNLQIRGIKHETTRRKEVQVKLPKLLEGTSVTKLDILGKPSTAIKSEIVKEPVILTGNERIPFSISAVEDSKSEPTTKVINPFSRKRNSLMDSDSTFCEEELARPGPSKLDVSFPPSRNIDSDVEIIDSNSILVINDSQPVVNNSPEWFRKSDPKNMKPIKRNGQNKKYINYSSEDGELLGSLPKKSRNALSHSDEQAVGEKEMRVNPLALKNKSNNPQLISSNVSARLKSPEIIPVAGSSKDTVSLVKNKKDRKRANKLKKHREFLKMPFSKLESYCPVCKEFQEDILCHVKNIHNCPPRGKKFSCRVCSKMYYFKKVLAVHKCKPLV